MELTVFGPIRAYGPSGLIEFARSKERTVLATLALFHGQAVSTDRLVDALWSDVPPERPEKAVQTYIQRVRAALGPEIVTTRSDGYALAADVVVDAELFEAESNSDGSAQDLRSALARWSGEPYVDLCEWAAAELERVRLIELRDRTLERCLALDIESGVPADCIPELEAMVADKPLREQRWFLLMTALSRDGRVADALRAYQRARKVFAEELGIDPGPELQSLEEQILLSDVRDASPGNLPRQMTSFVGHEGEVTRLADLVRGRSLVTLTGVGGVGKTRLALEVAVKAATEFPDGAWLCELAPVADPEALWERLAVSLGVPPSPGQRPRDLALGHLSAKTLLLVLDNCEHLLPAVSQAADAVMQRCPGVAILATSRERLAVAGEHVVAVSPLPIPRADATLDTLALSESVRLFCERALDVNDAFTLTDRNAPAVAQLCRHLDGLPLAIELAAARARSLSPDDLVARIDERFRLLTKGSRSTHERHLTLRNTIDWSYNLLTPTEQRVLDRMSVFAGGCDLASAEAVLGSSDVVLLDVVDILSELVDKSLVEVDASDGNRRYRLLETIRQYARERLEAAGETAMVRDRHLAHYVDRAEEAGPKLLSCEVVESTAFIAREIDNFRVAIDWAAESELVDAGLRLVVPLTVIGSASAWTVTDWLENVISIAGASQHPLYPLAASIAAEGTAMRVELSRAATLVALAQDAQTRLGTHYPEVHMAAGLLATLRGDLEQARRDARAGVDLARPFNDPYRLAAALLVYGFSLFPETDEAAVALEEAANVARDADLPLMLLHALCTLSQIIVHEQPSQARALLQEAGDAARKLGDPLTIARVVTQEAGLSLVLGDWQDALVATSDAAHQDLLVGGSLELGITLHMASTALTHLQRFEPAAVLAGFVDVRVPAILDREWDALFKATDSLLLDALGTGRTAELKAHGSTLSRAEAGALLRRERDLALADDLS